MAILMKLRGLHEGSCSSGGISFHFEINQARCFWIGDAW